MKRLRSLGVALGVGKFARFARQHDRYAVADGISETRLLAHQLLAGAIVDQRALGQRADENFEQFWIGFQVSAFN